MDSRSRRPVRRALAICCLLLAVGAMLPTSTSAAARATRMALQAASSKQADTQRLVELDAAITTLKARLAENPTSTRLQNGLTTAMAEYDEVSARLGGDRAPVLPTQPAASAGGLGGGPPAPPNCVATTSSFANATPVVIPTTISTITSTIVVSGAGTYLYDTDVITNITHTFNSDIDMTVTSPAGTVVTLTTDNGSSFDNVFNGTTWDDDANPAGQVPYTTNNGVVSDTTFADLTLASPLVPEEALGAFVGEDPNGTWTLTISDDANGDGGAVTWSLNLSTLPAPPTVANTTASNNTPVVIPTSIGVVTSTINVAGAGTSILDVDAITNITHTFNSDIDMTLTSPAGTVVTLTTDNGSSFDNTFNGTVWDDDANPAGQVPYTTNNGVATEHVYADLTLASPLVPEEAMGAFIGEDPNGTWTLTISDDANGDGGAVTWSLDIDTASCTVIGPGCTLTCPTDITTMATDLNGAVVNYPAPTAANCINVVCMPPSGSTFPVGTTVVTCTGDDDVPSATKTTEGGPMPCAESFDSVVAPALPTGWVAANASGPAPLWVTSSAPASFGVDTAPNAAFVDDPTSISDKRLDSAPIAVVSPTATMTFRRNHSFENATTAFDGMVLEISINGGAFQDILDAGGSFAVGGYGGVISSSFSNPLAGRSAFVGNSGGYQTTTVNLPAAANGFNVVFRWRMGSDSSVAATGVAIDSITTTGTNCGGGGGGGTSTCQFNVTVTIPFDSCCVDDATGDVFRQVVASVPPTSPLYGYWEYEVAATSEIFAGIGNHVAYRPGLSIIIDDNDDPAVYCHAEIDFPRRKCRVQVRDITTGRNFVLRDRNINNNMCTAAPPQM